MLNSVAPPLTRWPPPCSPSPSAFKDKVAYAVFGPNALYLLSREGAPRGKILRLPLSSAAAPSMRDAVVVVPESPDAGTALSEAIEQQVDVYAFLFKELGIRYQEPPAPPTRSSRQD